MNTTIQKWGNSLAVRLPRVFADEMGLECGTAVSLTIVDGQLVITPMKHPGYDLDALLAQVTPDNLHAEVSTGDPSGSEIW